MKTHKALTRRIHELCEKEEISWYELARRSGVPKTTLQSIKDGKSVNPGIETIKKITDGLDISLRDFFHSEYFD